jgi:hypothetical protein
VSFNLPAATPAPPPPVEEAGLPLPPLAPAKPVVATQPADVAPDTSASVVAPPASSPGFVSAIDR